MNKENDLLTKEEKEELSGVLINSIYGSILYNEMNEASVVYSISKESIFDPFPWFKKEIPITRTTTISGFF